MQNIPILCLRIAIGTFLSVTSCELPLSAVAQTSTPSDVDTNGRDWAPARAAFIPPSPKVIAPTATSDILDVGNAEKVSVKFRGNPDMSGDYRVNADATISVPVLGRIKVAGVTPDELERRLTDKMADLSGREAFVTVEIAEYRPVFVTGFVVKSGASAWQPGLTVLHAVAMSGGVYRPAEALARAMYGPADTERTRIKKAFADLKSALASMARLEAEHKGGERIDVPPRLITLAGKSDAEALIKTQQSLFDSRRVAYQNQISAMQSAISLAEDELGGLRAQTSRIQEQLGLRQENKSKVEELQQRGIVTGPRTLEEKIKVSDLQEKQTNVSVAIARVLSAAAGLKRDITKAKLERQSELELEIGKTQREIDQLEIELDAGKTALSRLSDELKTSVKAEEVIEYAIVRKVTDGTLQTNAADLSTQLRPGDIVMVSSHTTR